MTVPRDDLSNMRGIGRRVFCSCRKENVVQEIGIIGTLFMCRLSPIGQQNRPVSSSPDRTSEGLLHSGTCRMIYRIEKISERHGVPIARSTLAQWDGQLGVSLVTV